MESVHSSRECLSGNLKYFSCNCHIWDNRRWNVPPFLPPLCRTAGTVCLQLELVDTARAPLPAAMSPLVVWPLQPSGADSTAWRRTWQAACCWRRSAVGRRPSVTSLPFITCQAIKCQNTATITIEYKPCNTESCIRWLPCFLKVVRVQHYPHQPCKSDKYMSKISAFYLDWRWYGAKRQQSHQKAGEHGQI